MNTKNTKGNSSTLSLVVLAIVVMAIGLVAVLTDIRRASYGTDAAAAALATTSASNATTTATSTAASSSVTAKAAPKKTSVTPAKAAAPVKTAATSSTPVSSNTSLKWALCTANDLTGTANWQGASGSLSGTLNITNSSKANCSLSHDVYLQILSGNQVLPVGQLGNADANSYTDLAPGDGVPLGFIWSNWCGASLSSAAYVRLILPTNGGYLRVPVIDAAGRAHYDAPRCDSPQAYSSVKIWQ
ncbi:DUF4232 domain-containing protein [Candidatus Parcubacteria bacterium]|nr:DUF4232 domain-containing protein [Candidatus Parcubacteria bacterium]